MVKLHSPFLISELWRMTPRVGSTSPSCWWTTDQSPASPTTSSFSTSRPRSNRKRERERVYRDPSFNAIPTYLPIHIYRVGYVLYSYNFVYDYIYIYVAVDPATKQIDMSYKALYMYVYIGLGSAFSRLGSIFFVLYLWQRGHQFLVTILYFVSNSSCV